MLRSETRSDMAEFDVCLGHEQRVGRRSKIKKLLDSPLVPQVGASVKVLIKKGPVSVETTLGEDRNLRGNKIQKCLDFQSRH